MFRQSRKSNSRQEAKAQWPRNEKKKNNYKLTTKSITYDYFFAKTLRLSDFARHFKRQRRLRTFYYIIEIKRKELLRHAILF